MGTNQVADWACYLFVAYMLLLVLLQIRAWVVTIDLYGSMPWAEIKKTLGYKLGSFGAYQLFWPLFGIAAVLLSPILFGDVERPSLIAALVACLVYAWVYHPMPAAVLLLGNSGPNTLALRHRLERGIYPYRVVALLNAAAAEELPDASDVTNRLEWDNFRTVGSDWRAVVHPLMDATPLLVLDARIASEFVVEEAQRVLGRVDLLQKTVFVGANGTAPALAAGGPVGNRAVVTLEEGVIDLLKQRGLTRTNSPDDFGT